MADDDIKKGIEDSGLEHIPEELRGVIIDLEQKQKNQIWALFGLFAVLMIGIGGWSYYLLSKTEQDFIQEKLANIEGVAALLNDAHRIIRNHESSKELLETAINRAIDISETSLKNSDGAIYPFVKERYIAMMVALEGLLHYHARFSQAHLSDTETLIEQFLQKIGEKEVEYYESGILTRAPLIKQASVKKLMREQIEKGFEKNPGDFNALKTELDSLEEGESLSIVSAAYTLGKWYRYLNEWGNAERCFKIAIEYVDGDEADFPGYPGARPDSINPLWKEYVGCVEGIVEIRLFEGKYREARSYLARTYNTPTSKQNLKKWFPDLHTTSVETHQIQTIQRDIATLQKALDHPLELPGASYFTVGDPTIQWPQFLQALRDSKQNPGRSPINLLFESLSPKTKEALFAAVSIPICDEAKNDIIAEINELIDDPSFFKKASYNIEGLTKKGKELLGSTQNSTLPKADLTRLNREIFEVGSNFSFANDFVLSDGTRLENQLNNIQIQKFMELLEDTFKQENIDSELRGRIEALVVDVTGGKKIPTRIDFYQILEEREKLARTDIESIAEQEIALQNSLKDVKKRVEQLEISNQVQMGEIAALQKQEERLEGQINFMKKSSEDAKLVLDKLQPFRSALTDDLAAKFRERSARLDQVLRQQGNVEVYAFKNEESVLEKIDQQIQSRKEYLSLLNDLKNSGTGNELQRLKIERERIEALIAVSKDQLKNLNGDERERVQLELNELETSQFELIKDFDRLFTPLRKAAQVILVKEQDVWKTTNDLQKIQEEIYTFVGTKENPGILGEKKTLRDDLLKLKNDDLINSAIYDAELRQLNEEIAQDHSKLAALLQKELYAKEMLETFYPHICLEYPLFENQGVMMSVVKKLNQQEQILKEYRLLWAQDEVQNDIRKQEEIIFENLTLIGKSLDQGSILSDTETRNLSRYMENIVRAKNELLQSKRQLRDLCNNKVVPATLKEISRKGYLLDHAEFFDLENQMGLNITEYRRVFEKREEVRSQLISAIKEKDKTLQKKLEATRNRDQELLDGLLPLELQHEQHIALFSEKEAEVNTELRNLALDYKNKLDRVQKFRDGLDPNKELIRERITAINTEMSINEQELQSHIGNLFQTATDISAVAKAFKIEPLGNLDQSIEEQEKELIRLTQIQTMKYEEHYYQAKTIWLTAKTFFDESKFATFPELTLAETIDPNLLIDEARIAPLFAKEYDPTKVYTEELLGDVAEPDDNVANQILWTDHLEKTALMLFSRVLNNYKFINEEGKPSPFKEQNYQKDLDTFVAKAKFYTGEIHLQRALRNIRTSTLDVAENIKAQNELDLARTNFISYLDFSLPYAYEDIESKQLSEKRQRSNEFPEKGRFPVNDVAQGQIYLGIIANLKDQHLQAIDHYRDVLRYLAKEIPIYLQQRAVESDQAYGQLDPVVMEQFQFESGLHPFFASVFASNPAGPEALYRLGRSYQLLSDEQLNRARENEAINFSKSEQFLSKSKLYNKRAIAYFSQIILTQTFSPFKKGAHLQRALTRKELGDYPGARADLVAILGDPANSGGTFDHNKMTPKGDLPGELDPGYTFVSFELGKLHLEFGDYTAATEAFFNAKESKNADEFVLQAKIAYAETLIETRQWLMAEILLKELIEEREEVKKMVVRYYPIDLFLQQAHVKKEMGRYQDALEIYRKVFSFGPGELLNNGNLDLDQQYGISMLETNYRDSIRPLAEACRGYGDVSILMKNHEDAAKYFKMAERLYAMIPWKADRQFRNAPKEELAQFKKYNQLLCKWKQLQSDSLSLLQSSTAGYRKVFMQAYQAKGEFTPESITKEVELALARINEDPASYIALAERLEAFYNAEVENLAETALKRKITNKREYDRKNGNQLALQYESLNNLRNRILEQKSQKEGVVFNQFVKQINAGTIEEKLLTDFSYEYAKELDLTDDDKRNMLSHQSHIQNLLSIPSRETRLASFGDSFLVWIEEKMRDTGLDDLFIPVSPQAGILEEVALYQVSLLSFVDDYDQIAKMHDVIERHRKETEKRPSRIVSTETVWRMVEIGQLVAENHQDWDRAKTYCEFMLSDNNQKYFIASDKSDFYRTQLSYATALAQLSQKILADIVFVTNEVESKEKELRADQYMEQARLLLEGLAKSPGDSADITMTRIRAKQVANQIRG
jgi:hypothetical protein